jgi:hypothetical protein
MNLAFKQAPDDGFSAKVQDTLDLRRFYNTEIGILAY